MSNIDSNKVSYKAGGNFIQSAGHLYSKIFSGPAKLTYEQELLKEITQARRDWERAESVFNETTDTSLIDHAIYDMMAAKTRYSYLMNRAKEHGVNSASFPMMD